MTKARKNTSKKIIIHNSAEYKFEWKMGDSGGNVILENEKINVKLVRYLIESPENNRRYDTIAIRESTNNTVTVIQNQEGEIGLVREWRPIPARWFWACVRGFADPKDKNNLATAKRELIEEIGHCKIINSKKIGTLYQNTTYFENPVGLVRLVVKVLDNTISKEEGISDFKFFSKQEILSMIRENKIEDTLTLSALMVNLAIENS